MNQPSLFATNDSPPMKSGAVISECGLYRYRLWRVWEELQPIMVFVMQNPSTADANDDDPTIRKCIGFARKSSFGGIMVMNVFAYRATDEREMLNVADPIGPENEKHLLAARQCSLLTRLVVAWGNRFGPKKKSLFRSAYCNAACILIGQGPCCLGTTKSGDPKHPLFVPYSAPLVRWHTPEM